MSRFPEPTDRYPVFPLADLPEDDLGQLASKKADAPKNKAVRKTPAPTRKATGKEKLEQVAKYIPLEILGGYSWLCSQANVINPKDEMARRGVFGVIFLGVLILTPFYVAKMAVDRRFLRFNQWVASIAFVVWAFSSPLGIFHDLAVDPAPLPQIILGFFLLVTGLLEPKPSGK